MCLGLELSPRTLAENGVLFNMQVHLIHMKKHLSWPGDDRPRRALIPSSHFVQFSKHMFLGDGLELLVVRLLETHISLQEGGQTSRIPEQFALNISKIALMWGQGKRQMRKVAPTHQTAILTFMKSQPSGIQLKCMNTWFVHF